MIVVWRNFGMWGVFLLVFILELYSLLCKQKKQEGERKEIGFDQEPTNFCGFCSRFFFPFRGLFDIHCPTLLFLNCLL